MSFGKPIAIESQMELGKVALAARFESFSNSDEEFLELLKNGDAEAFDQLVTSYSESIYKMLSHLTGDAEEAHDLTQETFLQAFRGVGNFRGDADLKTWLFRIALNQARNRWRWWQRWLPKSFVSLDAPKSDESFSLHETLSDDSSKSPEAELLSREETQNLRNALQNLSPQYREAVILRDIEGFNYEEIAVALETNVGTVKSRIARGRLELKKKLTQ